MFNWAIAEGIIDRSPFKRHGVTVVKLNGAAEAPRVRRLEEGEEELLLKHANQHMQSIIIAALETGCRLGELLSMQWSQVKWRDGVIVLPAAKTKVNEARSIPMTQRLKAVLETRRTDPTGQEFGPDAYVFGNEVGEQARSIRTAWENCRRRAKVEGLHFHDLRREFASRLLESPGVALHDVAQWVGHANVLTTTRYLAVTATRLRRTLDSFESSRTGESTSAEREPADSVPS
jgi:integrase